MDWFMKDFIKTEDYLLNQVLENSENPIDLHFTYNKLIRLYYKFRGTRPDATKKCLVFCGYDIELFPIFEKAYKSTDYYSNVMPVIPSFKYSVMLHEQLGWYDDAIHFCTLAIHYSIDDGTKGGFKARLEKLRKKVTLQNK